MFVELTSEQPGNKVITGDTHRPVTLGYEGVRRIVALGNEDSGFRKGNCVAILPHILSSSRHDLDMNGNAQKIDPAAAMIGRHETLHMGWDLDGCFADFITVAATNLMRVDPYHLY